MGITNLIKKTIGMVFIGIGSMSFVAGIFAAMTLVGIIFGIILMAAGMILIYIGGMIGWPEATQKLILAYQAEQELRKIRKRKQIETILRDRM